MTARNCENCGQPIGPLEESFSFYSHLVCKACRNKLEGPFQSPTIPADGIEVQTPGTDQKIEKSTPTEHQEPLLEKKAAPLPSHTSLPQSENMPDPQSPNKAPSGSQHQKLPRWCRPKRKVLWFAIGILVLLALVSAILVLSMYQGLRDNRFKKSTQSERQSDTPIIADPPEGFVLDEPDRVPSFEEIIKKSGLEPHQRQEKDFLKSVIDNELAELTIAKPDIDALIQKANQNSASAQYDLGKVYCAGTWLPKNEPLALNLFLKSAEQGNADAKRTLYDYIFQKLLSVNVSRLLLRNKEDISEGLSERLKDTVGFLATCNEKAFVPNHTASTEVELSDLLDSHRYETNLQSFPVTEDYKAEIASRVQSKARYETLWNQAKNGNIHALCILGGEFPNSREELQFLLRAAELGHVEAQFACGRLHWRDGFSMYDTLLQEKLPEEQHLKEAKKWYTKAAQNGHIEAQFQLAEIELKSDNDETASEWYKRAANIGHIGAQIKLAERELTSGNYEAALNWYTKSAILGSEEAVRAINSMMTDHESVKALCLEALSGILEEQHDLQSSNIRILQVAAYKLAITNDPRYCKQALAFLKKLAENYDSPYNFSAHSLAFIYSQKKGCPCEGVVEKDIEKAIYWYKRSGDKEALANLYYEEKEYAESFPIFKRLAEKDRDKCTRYSYWALGYSYFKGLGTVRDYYQAYKWLLVYSKYDPDFDVTFAEEKLSVERISQAQHEASQVAKAIDARHDQFIKQLKELEEQANTTENNWLAKMYYSEWREDLESVSKLLAQALPVEKIPTSYAWIRADDQDRGSEEDNERPDDLSGQPAVAQGTGFLLSSSGLVATNYHVISDGKRISIYFPKADLEFDATVELKDISSDLAVLKIKDFAYDKIFSDEVPFAVKRSSDVQLGEKVFTLGFPLGELLGKSAKFSDGTISSVTGLLGSANLFQINNPIQPGNSGGPLFDGDGNLIGIVVAMLDAKFFYENLDTIPQNVNFAIKSDYLISLISTLPEGPSILSRRGYLRGKSQQEQITSLVPFVVTVSVR